MAGGLEELGLDEYASAMFAIRELRRQTILDFLTWLERERGIRT